MDLMVLHQIGQACPRPQRLQGNLRLRRSINLAPPFRHPPLCLAERPWLQFIRRSQIRAQPTPLLLVPRPGDGKVGRKLARALYPAGPGPRATIKQAATIVMLHVGAGRAR